MRGRDVVNQFVNMCYNKGGSNCASGNYKAFRDRETRQPRLTLFGNQIAWLKNSWGDTNDIIETSDCGWNTRTTRKALNWVKWFAAQVRIRRQQDCMFEE